MLRTLEIGILSRFEAGRSHPGLFIPLGEESDQKSAAIAPARRAAVTDGHCCEDLLLLERERRRRTDRTSFRATPLVRVRGLSRASRWSVLGLVQRIDRLSAGVPCSDCWTGFPRCGRRQRVAGWSQPASLPPPNPLTSSLSYGQAPRHHHYFAWKPTRPARLDAASLSRSICSHRREVLSTASPCWLYGVTPRSCSSD